MNNRERRKEALIKRYHSILTMVESARMRYNEAKDKQADIEKLLYEAGIDISEAEERFYRRRRIIDSLVEEYKRNE